MTMHKMLLDSISGSPSYFACPVTSPLVMFSTIQCHSDVKQLRKLTSKLCILISFYSVPTLRGCSVHGLGHVFVAFIEFGYEHWR